MSYYFITRFFYPDESSGNALLLKLCQRLVEENKSVCVITSNRVNNSQKKLPKKSNVYGIDIIRLPTFSTKDNNILLRLMNYMIFLFNVFFYILLRLNEKQLVISMSDPPFLSVITSLACKLLGIKQIQWIQDVYPEIARSVGLKIPFFKILVFFRNWSIRNSYLSVVISDEMKDYFIKNGIEEHKLEIIHNWTDNNQIFPIEKDINKYYSKFVSNNKFVIGYSGNLGVLHDFESVIESIKELEDFNDIKFIFIGSGAKKEELEKFKESYNPKNMSIFPFQKKEVLNFTLNVPDVHLITLGKKVSPFAYPSKIYGAMAAGKPLLFIGEKNSEMFKFIEENEIGFSIENDDKDRLVEKIIYLYENERQLKKLGLKSREVFEQNFTFEISVKKWTEILEYAGFQN